VSAIWLLVAQHASISTYIYAGDFEQLLLCAKVWATLPSFALSLSRDRQRIATLDWRWPHGWMWQHRSIEYTSDLDAS